MPLLAFMLNHYLCITQKEREGRREEEREEVRNKAVSTKDENKQCDGWPEEMGYRG